MRSEDAGTGNPRPGDLLRNAVDHPHSWRHGRESGTAGIWPCTIERRGFERTRWIGLVQWRSGLAARVEQPRRPRSNASGRISNGGANGKCHRRGGEHREEDLRGRVSSGSKPYRARNGTAAEFSVSRLQSGAEVERNGVYRGDDGGDPRESGN